MRKAILIASISIYVILWIVVILKIDIMLINFNNFFKLMYLIGFVLSLFSCGLMLVTEQKHSLEYKFIPFALAFIYFITYVIILLQNLNHHYNINKNL